MQSPFEWKQIPRGFLMGGADIVPGVSGGTVALILGIYERLVTAISHFDLTTVGLIGQREFRRAAERIDLGFLAGLGTGVLIGVVSLASLMNHLLNHQLQLTFSVFFGLILGSSYLVWRMIGRHRIDEITAAAAGAVLTFWFVGLPLLSSPPETPWYFFLAGTIAICAMILPGISGSFILLLLGVYGDVTGMLRGFKAGEFAGDSVLLMGAFCCGCAVGLIGFSKVLKWLLDRCESIILAILAGVMLGSLRKLWPFKRELTTDAESFKERIFVNVLPDTIDGDLLLSVVLMILSTAAIVGLDRYSNLRSDAELPALNDSEPGAAAVGSGETTQSENPPPGKAV